MLIYARDHASAVLRRLNRELVAADAANRRVAAGAAVVGQTLTYIGGAGVLAMIKAANSAGKFQSQMGLLRIASHANAQEMARMQRLAIDLGNDLRLPGVTAQDVALTMMEMARAGISVKDIMSGIRGTLNLAVAAEMDFGEAAKISSGILNGFRLEGAKATEVADMLAAAANASTAELMDIGIAARQSTSAFAKNHQTVSSMATALALLANAGIRGSMAGTTLKVMFERLTAPTDKAKAAMDKLGVSVFDAHGKMRPLRDLIIQFTEKTKNLTDAEEDKILHTIFGTRANQAAFQILTRGVQQYDKMHKAVMEQGMAQKLAQARMQEWARTVEALKNAISTLAIELGLQLIPKLTRIIQHITKAVQWYSQLREEHKSLGANVLFLATSFTLLAAVAARIVQIFARLWPVFSFLGRGIGLVGRFLIPLIFNWDKFLLMFPRTAAVIYRVIVAIRALAVAMGVATATTPLGWIMAIIGAIILLGAIIYRYRKPIWDFLVGIWQDALPVIKAAWSAIVNAVVTASNAIWQAIQRIWHSGIMQVIRDVIITIVNIVRTYWTILIEIVKTGAILVWQILKTIGTLWWVVFSTTWRAIIAIVRFAWRIISPVVRAGAELVAKIITTYFKAVREIVHVVWTAVRIATVAAWQFIWGIIGNRVKQIWAIIQPAFTRILAFLRTIWNGVRSVFSAAFNAITQFVRVWVGGMRQIISRAMDFLRRAFRDGGEGARAWLVRKFEELRGFIRRLPGWFAEAGRDILRGLLRGLKEVWEAVKRWFLGIPAWIKAHKGPLELDRQLLVPAGKAIMGGFLRGLRSGSTSALGFVKGIVGSVWDVTYSLWNKAQGVWSSVGGLFGGRGGANNLNRRLGQAVAAQRGWTGMQWNALDALILSESGWSNTAKNPTSTAFGIGQFLSSTQRAYGISGVLDPLRQIMATYRYIADRYGNPMNAWAFKRIHNFYAQGGDILEHIVGLGMRTGQVYHFGEAGPERVTPMHGRGGGKVINQNIIINTQEIDPRRNAAQLAWELQVTF